LLEYLSSENYKDEEILEENFRNYAERALGLQLPLKVKFYIKMDEIGKWCE